VRRIVHLSDLHFGRISQGLVGPLVEAVNGLKPDLIVISGDYTQRARHWQFEEAAKFLSRLDAPTLSVPGNHDTPLDNLFLRFLAPWRRYRRYIATDLEPVWSDEEIVVVGLNTVNHFAWQQGRLSRRALARVNRLFATETERTCIAVMHHPLQELPGNNKAPMRGAAGALHALAENGADMVLSGHIHTAHVAPFTARPGVLFVQAGTSLSDRLRGVGNSFNLLDISDTTVRLSNISASDTGEFRMTVQKVFSRTADSWRASTSPSLPTEEPAHPASSMSAQA
jgi:3',5'-cyclic AMP phosphodiesterase CpdA